MNPEPLDLFVDNLIKEANLDLPADFRGQFVEKLKEQINRRLGLALMEDLDEAGIAEFSQLMGQEPQPDFTAIQAFYSARIPNLEEKIKSTLADFAGDFVTASQK